MRKYRQCDQRRKRSDKSAAGSGDYSQRSKVKSHDFRPHARRREQKRVSFGALRNAGSKKGSLSESCATQGVKNSAFRSVRYAAGASIIDFGLCETFAAVSSRVTPLPYEIDNDPQPAATPRLSLHPLPPLRRPLPASPDALLGKHDDEDRQQQAHPRHILRHGQLQDRTRGTF